jgi:N-acetylmuramoyl-L-alanine amidase
LAIHHTASSSGSVAQITAEHKARGWLMAGYHSILGNGHGMPDGSCEQARPDAMKGSAVWGANTGVLHIALIGQFAPEAPNPCPVTGRQLATLGEWLLHRAVRYHCTEIKGHKELALPGHATACPGNLPLDLIRAWFAQSLPYYQKHGQALVSLAAHLGGYG